MSDFKPLTQEQISLLLEGQEDVLTPLAKQEQALLRTLSCPSCGSGALSQTLNAHRPFSSGSPLPNILLSCRECEAEFDPHSRVITKAPTRERG